MTGANICFRRSFTLVVAVVVLISAAALAVRAATSVKLNRGDAGPLDTTPKIALAYASSYAWTPPDPYTFTHIIYAFAEFNDDCDGLDIEKPDRLQRVADLKKKNPDLKVILGVGGYKRKGFSEMARDKKKRKAFVKEVNALIDSLNLDGVDLDWEFPTTEDGGHTATPDDDKNYVTLVKDLRKALGKEKWISFYSTNSGDFIDLKRMVPYVDYVNVSGYNLTMPHEGQRAYHQSPLYPTKKLGEWCIKSVVERHIDLGVPVEKILLGIPFFGRGKHPFPSYVDCKDLSKYTKDLVLKWDNDARAPYYADKDGNLVLGFDNEMSIKEKFDFIRANRLPGIFVWHYDGDYDDHRLAKTIQQLRK